MRNLLIPLAAAASALVVATPASAQWFPQPQQYGYNYGYGVPQGYGYAAPQGYGYAAPYGYSYGAPYGNAYGYQNNFGQIRNLQVRINALQRQINRLDSRDILSEREAHGLRHQSRNLEHRLLHASRYGLAPQEYANLHYGIERLEYRISVEARDGNRWRRGSQWQRSHNQWHRRNGRH